jgi:hypothetical protein
MPAHATAAAVSDVTSQNLAASGKRRTERAFHAMPFSPEIQAFISTLSLAGSEQGRVGI